jgi:chloramphenicol O-acetyltransferase type A
MFEWPIATPIALESFTRRHLYEHFVEFDIPVTYRTIQIDVTALRQFCKERSLKFSQTIGFILTRANNHVPELRLRIVDNVLVEYNKIIPAYTVMMPNKVFAFMRGVYTDVFDDDYLSNLAIHDRVVRGHESVEMSPNQGQIFITVNPWTTQTSVQAPFSRKVASMPVFCIGKMYDQHGRTLLGLGLQVHHGLVDGYHIGHFVHNVQRHLDDPSLVLRPFTSSFESEQL